MNTRSRVRLAWALNGLLALTGVAVGAGLVLLPVVEPVGRRPAAAPVASGKAARERPLLSAYDVISARDLQQPLFDAPPETRPIAKPTVTLAGTVVQPGNTYALLKTRAGQVQWASVGQSVDGAEVLEIAADAATIRFAGVTYTLKVERPGAGP